MAAHTTRNTFGKWASVLLMLIALLWLSVSTPFVYAAQQTAAAVAKAEQPNADEDADTNPLSGTTEEKSESGVNTISEYLHETLLPGSPAEVLVKYEKCHPSDLYFAYHPETLCPPPNTVC